MSVDIAGKGSCDLISSHSISLFFQCVPHCSPGPKPLSTVPCVIWVMLWGCRAAPRSTCDASTDVPFPLL